MRRFLATAALAVFAATPVAADPVSECYQLFDTHSEASACLTQRVKGTEGVLKDAYAAAQKSAAAMEKVTDGSMKPVAPLEASQKAFETYRKAACDEAIPPMWGGGSGTGDAVAACQIEMNRQRAAFLKENYPAGNN